MSVQNLDVAIPELDVGQTLSCDVLDASGIILLKKGCVLSQDVVDSWTRRGFARVLLRRQADVDGEGGPVDAEEAKLSRPYDPRLIKELNECFDTAKRAVDEIIYQLSVKDEPDTSALEPVFHSYLNAIQADLGVVLYSAASQKNPPGKNNNHALATRSIQMAMLGAATAATMNLSREQCQEISIAALLHDISLFEEPLAALQSGCNSADERRDVLFRHSLHSAELFSHCHGVSDLVRIVITQVHEQIDGHGFPRGLAGHRMNILSRILNIVDAYLTLIEPSQSQSAFVPSDAIAYLVNHTSNGAFDRECMKAFLNALSIYAVGSQVELDDSRTATILRSSKTDPLRPIIRIDDGSNTIVDLRRSKLNVARPILEPDFPHRRRLPKAQMQAVLWKPLF